MESIFDELQKKAIAPQNFSNAIVVCIVYIISYCVYFFVHTLLLQSILNFTDGILGIYILFFFREYLRNFKARKAIEWMNWHLIYAIIITAYYFIFDAHEYLYFTRVTDIKPSSVRGIYHAVVLATIFWGFCTSLGLGLSLQRIKDDRIGYLRVLGILYTYLVAAFKLRSILIRYSNETRQFVQSALPLPQFVITTLLLSPTLVLIIIFSRARHSLESVQHVP